MIISFYTIPLLCSDSTSSSSNCTKAKREKAKRRTSQKVSFYLILRLKLLVLNNIMSSTDYSWHFANNLNTDRSNEMKAKTKMFK